MIREGIRAASSERTHGGVGRGVCADYRAGPRIEPNAEAEGVDREPLGEEMAADEGSRAALRLPRAQITRLRAATRGLAREIRAQQRRTLQPEREATSGTEWSDLFEELRGRMGSLATTRGAAKKAEAVASADFATDAAFRERLLPLLDFLFDRYWRVQLLSDWNLPAQGPMLLVANRAGVLPWDGMMLSHATSRLFDDGARPRFLVEDAVARLPFAAAQLAQVGGVRASVDNFEALMREGHSVVHFPEGARGVLHSFRERYRVGNFDETEILAAALERGAQIVPVGIVGAEEAVPRLGDARLLSRLVAREIDIPILPRTPTFPLLGPMGLLPLPSRWAIAFGEPIEGGEVARVATRLRTQVQKLVEQALDARTSTWL